MENIDLYDLQGLAITTENGVPLFHTNFTSKDTTQLLKQASTCKQEIFEYETSIVLLKKIDELNIVFYASANRNPILLQEFIVTFCDALVRIIKKPKVKKIVSRYDLVCLLTNEFVYNGIVVETDVEKLIVNIPRRSFESIECMKIDGGLFKKK